MTVFNSEMHVVTFLFVVLETIMFLCQVIFYAQKPREEKRIYYIILLLLLIVYNVTGGLFPDINIHSVSIVIQNILAYGAGFSMACFIPYYFYKAFDLKKIRFHAIYGVFLFLFIPFVVFIVIDYSIHSELKIAVSKAVVLPFFYALYLLLILWKAIRDKFKNDNSMASDMLMTYLAIMPWATMPIMSFFQVSQLPEVLVTNVGFIIVTFLFIRNNILQTWEDDRRLLALSDHIGSDDELVFEENCIKYNLTSREIELAKFIGAGFKYKDIAEKLYISERTVTKHVQNIYQKVNVANKIELIKKLEAKVLDINSVTKSTHNYVF